jgi:hypothetical protein
MWYMNHMVQHETTSVQPKDRLLNAAVEHALDTGIMDLSLREIASEIAVVREVERRERQILTDAFISIDAARRLWDRLVEPSLRAQERLFFEIYSHALLSRPGTEGFLEEALEGWISPVVESMTRLGVDQKQARVFARLGLAVTRGLLLDLLATGDSSGATQAFEFFIALLEQTTMTL